MNKNKFQAGSAHLIIIIVVVITTLALLGVVYWNNNTHSKLEPSTVDSTIESSRPSEITADGKGFSVQYPETWNVVDGSDTPTDYLRIAGPSKQVSVFLRIWSFYQSPGITDDANRIHQKVLYVNSEDMPKLPGNKFVELVLSGDLSNSSSDNKYSIGVLPSSVDIKVGDIVLDWNSTHEVDGYDGSTTFAIDLSSLPDGKSFTIDDFKNAISTDDYKTAKSIVESLSVKK